MTKRTSVTYNIDNLVEFYEKNVKKHHSDIKSVAWGSRQSQRKRFEILSQIADIEGKTVLDVGCGLGDYYGWLKDKYDNIHYAGIDITPSMITIASKNYPEIDFKVQNILELEQVKSEYDYVLASGIFNRKIPKHKCFVEDTIKSMFELSRRGTAFNIMSTKADFMYQQEYYADPGAMLNFCLKLSRKTVLRHDYMPHDFTVYVYK